MVIGSPEYFYWRDQCKDFTDKHLMAGYQAAGGFQGYFTIGEFRKLCIDGYRTLVEQNRRAEPPTTARLSDMSSFGKGPRFKELAKVTQAMMREGPDGPITRATKDNRLTNRNVHGKSAEEIIAWCKELYA